VRLVIGALSVDWETLPDKLTSVEVAQIFGVERKTVSRWSLEGRLPLRARAEGEPGSRSHLWRKEVIRELYENRVESGGSGSEQAGSTGDVAGDVSALGARS
jgi:hypothetical protein